MFTQIVIHTPKWVWALLILLVAAGVAQLRARRVSLQRATLLPAILLVLSMFGVVNTFGMQDVALPVWAITLAAALLFGPGWVAPRGAAWSNATRELQVPGSALPLVLISALFITKYAAGASLAIHPALAHDPAFSAACAAAYGAFSGLFAARALALWRLTRTPAAVAQGA
jgi:hypothetical protein